MSKILITRPIEDAEPLSKILGSKGFDVMIEPMISINIKDNPPEELENILSKNPQAVLITSANGLRALAKLTNRGDLKIITVGESSAKEALEYGYENTQSAGGDVKDLIEYTKKNLDPNDGIVLHAAGKVTSGNLEQELSADGFEFKRSVLYEAIATKEFSTELKDALKNKALDSVIFYSGRTAEIFLENIHKENLGQYLQYLSVFCISKTVSNKVIDKSKEFNWLEIKHAKYPNQESLLELLNHD